MNQTGVTIIGEYDTIFKPLLEEAGIAPERLLSLVAINGAVSSTAAPDTPLGDWFEEPDVVHWTDEETGYQCVILRAPRSLHLCGYVLIDYNHPLNGMDVDTVRLTLPCVRPVSFVSDGFPAPHLLETSCDFATQVFGFHCAENWDYVPGHHKIENKGPKSYRTVPQVAGMCRELALTLRSRSKH